MPDEDTPFGEEYEDDPFVPEEEEAESEFPEMDDLLSNYQEEQAQFNEEEQEFIDRYGFVHHCKCAEDWATGNLGVVSVCYLSMVADAMDTLEKSIKELKDAKHAVAELRIKNAA